MRGFIMCGIIGFIAKNNVSMRLVLDAKYMSILDRGVHFNRVDKENESYGYSRLPTDAVNDTTLDKIHSFRKGDFLFNGHITNTEDLCRMFNLSEECKFSDTKCITEGFSRYKEKFLSVCRGMFAFAYSTEEEIYLVRDTVGIKPLYYINSDKIFGFCSEIKGLTTDYTDQIHEVLPGEMVIYNKFTKTIKKEKYIYKSYKRYTKKDLQKCLYESIILPTRRYLDQSTECKVGVLVSGGVDSSLIIGMLNKYLSKDEKKRVVGFCIGMLTASDAHITKQLAKNLDIKLVFVKPYGKRKSLNKIPEIVYKVESPFSRVVKVALLQDALAEQLQKRDIHIVISGEGADELFYGYERFINGLTKKDTDKMFSYFFQNVFYNTLLQRFERIFANRQIEGRVPFLDQELIVMASKFTVDEKIHYYDTMLSKMPLRILAKEIGLPSYIYLRKKVKMTEGVTKLKNAESDDGYLEKYFKKNLKKTFGEYVYENYAKYGYTILSSESFLGTEEEAMKQVALLQEQNLTKKEVFL